MIYSLNGKLIASKNGVAVVECSGVGYMCNISFNTQSNLPSINENVFLFTYMNVREDAVDLFGFYNEEELDCFKLLISVSGVGPKAALAILSEFTADKLLLVLASEDSKALTKASGVGIKLASRIVLELKDKVKNISTSEDVNTISNMKNSETNNMSEAISALVALGYSQTDASLALKGQDPNDKTENLIKNGLKSLNLNKF